MDTYKEWRDMCHQLGVDYSTESIVKMDYWYDYLIKQYSSENRHYHNLNHIVSLIKLSNHDKKSHYTISPKLVHLLLFAIWFHDVIYDVIKKDNEEQSAKKAKECLEDLGLSKTKNYYGPAEDFVEKLIVATKHDKKEDLYWCQYICDIDTLILSSHNWEQYQEYSENIRKEYSFFSDKDWNHGRINFLENILKNKENIYYLSDVPFNNRILGISYVDEERAKENIKKEIGFLNENRSLQSNVSREPCSVS
jgi:predicted metal-dependent HD superfamily phosphohydrolase